LPPAAGSPRSPRRCRCPALQRNRGAQQIGLRGVYTDK